MDSETEMVIDLMAHREKCKTASRSVLDNWMEADGLSTIGNTRGEACVCP